MSLSRTNVLRHIDRYNLSGTIESVIWDITDEEVNIGFISPDNTVIGNLFVQDFDFDVEHEIGILQTSRLKKLVRILEDEFEVDFDYQTKDGYEVPTTLAMDDGQKKVQFRLTDTDIPPRMPTIKRLPDFNATIPITEAISTDFRSADKALDESEFGIQEIEDGVEIIVGHTSGNRVRHNNKVRIPVPCEVQKEFSDTVVFNSDVFSEILKANDDAEDGTWEVSSEGMSRIEFEGENWAITYYLIS